MHRWGWAVLAIAVVGCQQGQPAGSPFAGFQNTTLPAPSTGSYGSARGGLQSASAAGVGAAPASTTIPQGWQSGAAATPGVGAGGVGGTPAPTVGAGAGSSVPPALPPTGNDAYYPSSSTTSPGAGFGSLASQLQGMPVNDAVAGVRPSGSFGAGGSFASPGNSYGAPVVGYGPTTGTVAPATFEQPVATTPTLPFSTYGPSMNPSSTPASTSGGTSALGTSPAQGARPVGSSPAAANVPPSWNGAAAAQDPNGLQWRAR